MAGYHATIVFLLLVFVVQLISVNSALVIEREYGLSDKSRTSNRHHRARGSNRSFLLPYVTGTYGEEETYYRRGQESIFRAIWDVPNHCQEKHGIEIPLSDFGIEFNKDHSWWAGDVLTVFTYNLGYCPYVQQDGGFINGGLPQLGNITSHLEKVTDDVMTAIPDPDYQGLVMIDWEAWQPQWDSIEHRYRTYSTDHVRVQHPEWDNATITVVAELEWMQGSRLFMESTIKLAKELRPKAMWGYYHYPYCDVPGKNATCRSGQSEHNDEIAWLFDESTILYPSIYLTPNKELDFEAAVQAKLSEAFRIRAKSKDPKGAVMSYTRFNYSNTDYYLSLEDLNHTILTSAEFGTHGVVFWGDNYDDGTAQTCMELRNYTINALGPTVVMAREGAESCSKRVCSGRGRCVGDILSCGKSDLWKAKKQRDYGKLSVCKCRCLVGWGGDDCSIKRY